MSRTPGDGLVKENSPRAPVQLPVLPVTARPRRSRERAMITGLLHLGGARTNPPARPAA